MPPSSPLPHLWRAVDQNGMVLDILVQSRCDKHAAKRLLRKSLKKQMRSPRLLITDKLRSYGAAKREIMRLCCRVLGLARKRHNRQRLGGLRGGGGAGSGVQGPAVHS